MTHPAYGVVRPVLPFAAVLLENNPSPMTLEGTNSWIARAPESDACVVIDPGMDDIPHLELLSALAPVELIVLTHGHGDHADGARWLADKTHSPIRAFDSALCRDAPPLIDGERLNVAGVDLRVRHSPGHTPDSVLVHCSYRGTQAVFTGDTVIGAVGTSVTDLGAYLSALRFLAQLPPGTYGLPGHGREFADLRVAAQQYLDHRLDRLEQVRQAAADLGDNAAPRDIVEKVYSTVDRSLWPAAENNVRVQLEYLRSTTG